MRTEPMGHNNRVAELIRKSNESPSRWSGFFGLVRATGLTIMALSLVWMFIEAL